MRIATGRNDVAHQDIAGFVQTISQAGDLVFAIFFLAVSLFLLARLGGQTELVKRTGTVAQPAFWPTVAVALMTGFAVPAPHRFSGVSAGRGALGGGEILDSIRRIRALVHGLCLDGCPAGLSSFLNRFSRAPGLSTRLSGATETGFCRRVGRDGRRAFQIPASGQGSRRRWRSVRSAA